MELNDPLGQFEEIFSFVGCSDLTILCNFLKVLVKMHYITKSEYPAKENNSSNVQKIEIDNTGEFRTHWRDGFFSERLDDLF